MENRGNGHPRALSRRGHFCGVPCERAPAGTFHFLRRAPVPPCPGTAAGPLAPPQKKVPPAHLGPPIGVPSAQGAAVQLALGPDALAPPQVTLAGRAILVGGGVGLVVTLGAVLLGTQVLLHSTLGFSLQPCVTVCPATVL